jgi:hypothetical protein
MLVSPHVFNEDVPPPTRAELRARKVGRFGLIGLMMAIVLLFPLGAMWKLLHQ